MTTLDSLQPLQEEASSARKLPTRADVLKYYANAPHTVEPTVNPAAEVERKISKINHLIDAELATNADLQPDLFFHGTNDQAWESIQQSGQFQITAGRASLTRTPTYSNERYAVQGSETTIIQTLQDTLPRFQAEGLVDTSGTIVEQLQQVSDLLSQPKFKEMYGRLLVIDTKKVAERGFTISSKNASGIDSAVGVESFSVYPTGVSAENVDPNQQKLALDQEVISAAIIPTELVSNMLSELRINLIQQKQFNVAELQKVAMLYFGLASNRQVELGASDQAEDARLQQLVHMGREVVLSEVHAYFQERIHFADHILNLVEGNTQANITRTNFVDTVEETLQQLRNLQTYAAGFNLPSITEFVNSNIEVFSQRYQRLLELHTQLATQGQASESPSTLQATDSSTEILPLQQRTLIPPVVGAAIRRIFRL